MLQKRGSSTGEVSVTGGTMLQKRQCYRNDSVTGGAVSQVGQCYMRGQCHQEETVSQKGQCSEEGQCHRRGSVTGGAVPSSVTGGAVSEEGQCHRISSVTGHFCRDRSTIHADAIFDINTT